MIGFSASKQLTIHPIEFNSTTKLVPPPRPSQLTASVCRRRHIGLRVSCSKSPSEVEGDDWLKKLPEKTKPLYAHSLPCVEAWLRKLGFCQSSEDRAIWSIELKDWHAQLYLDVTDLYIRYLKTGPGGLEKDVERRFSYALSREDIENAILGGP